MGNGFPIFFTLTLIKIPNELSFLLNNKKLDKTNEFRSIIASMISGMGNLVNLRNSQLRVSCEGRVLVPVALLQIIAEASGSRTPTGEGIRLPTTEAGCNIGVLKNKNTHFSKYCSTK